MWIVSSLRRAPAQFTELSIARRSSRQQVPDLEVHERPRSSLVTCPHTFNNPIKYKDPSGHRVCEEASNCNGYFTHSSSTITEWLIRDFSWNISGNLSKKELGIIYGAGSTIQNYIESIGGNGGEWIRKHLGDTVFVKNSATIKQARKINASAFVWPYNTVRMSAFPLDRGTIIHELGHVLDNNQKGGIIPATVFGGGPADDMVKAMGGNPTACIPRLQCWSVGLKPLGYKWYIDNVAGRDSWDSFLYGNNGVSDDFAETFMWTLVDPQHVPSSRLMWMRTYLALLP